jgi:hypothetical protein
MKCKTKNPRVRQYLKTQEALWDVLQDVPERVASVGMRLEFREVFLNLYIGVIPFVMEEFCEPKES